MLSLLKFLVSLPEMEEIEYIVRKSGEKAVEKVPGGGLMRFLYGGNPLGKLALWTLIKRKLFSHIGGWYMDSRASARRVAPFVKQYQIPIEIYYTPEVGYKSFNQFFYRKIRAKYRPIGEGVVSPADGKILVFPEIKDSQAFFVKGQPFNLSSFLRNETLVHQYSGGAMAIIRLATGRLSPVSFSCFRSSIRKYKNQRSILFRITIGFAKTDGDFLREQKGNT